MRKPEDTTACENFIPYGIVGPEIYTSSTDKLREEHRQFEVEHWKKQCYERTIEIQKLKGKILELEYEIDKLREG